MSKQPIQNLRGWSIQDQTQPSVRVGVILSEDKQKDVRIDIPAKPYRISITGKSFGEFADTNATIVLRKNELHLSVGDKTLSTSEAIRIEAMAQDTSATNAMLVHNVIAGRGFHWQKRCDQSLPGTAEIRAGTDGIVLINELPLESYLAGVITAEMSGDCPEEFLKAQCAVARSWLLAFSETKHDADAFDRCNDDCCQRYQGIANTSHAARRAVEETKGLVLLDDSGRVVDAVYSKCCGGISETPESVWGHAKPCVESIIDAAETESIERFWPMTGERFDSYLQAGEQLAQHVYCSPVFVPTETHSRYLGHVDEPDNYYRWSVTQSRQQLEEVLTRRVPQLSGLARLDSLRVMARGVSGRAQALEVEWTDGNRDSHKTTISPEYNIREALHAGFLYSSAFAIEISKNESNELNSITLSGLGWGHGAGLCQIGALGMGLSGKNHIEILGHYFPSATLSRAYR